MIKKIKFYTFTLCLLFSVGCSADSSEDSNDIEDVKNKLIEIAKLIKEVHFDLFKKDIPIKFKNQTFRHY